MTGIQQRLIQDLHKTTEFIILPTDKNLGPAIIERDECIHLAFRDHLNDDNINNKLILIFDNCPGHNKNNTVLRLGLCFAAMKIFRSVEIVFVIKGHTKNEFDRLFNLVKKKFWHFFHQSEP